MVIFLRNFVDLREDSFNMSTNREDYGDRNDIEILYSQNQSFLFRNKVLIDRHNTQMDDRF